MLEEFIDQIIHELISLGPAELSALVILKGEPDGLPPRRLITSPRLAEFFFAETLQTPELGREFSERMILRRAFPSSDHHDMIYDSRFEITLESSQLLSSLILGSEEKDWRLTI